MEAQFYTRAGCHLCDEAAQMLRDAGLGLEVIDIDEQPELRARYDRCVPVVVVNGKVRFRGRVDRLLLQRLIDAGGEQA